MGEILLLKDIVAARHRMWERASNEWQAGVGSPDDLDQRLIDLREAELRLAEAEVDYPKRVKQ